MDVVIPGDLIEYCYSSVPVQYENFRAVKAVLENPRRIFAGVRLLNQGGWCYVGRPSEWYIRENTIVPFSAEFVFAVYVNPNFRLYEFRAEKADPDDPESPIDWAERYGALIWKHTF
ncbi:MAG TPA: hypothetical protein PLI09_16230 [Candidatus Hydrogenedentes bacterium]|nr:hypothetical protein [Candidatus Hydrogenedentota bacterium]